MNSVFQYTHDGVTQYADALKVRRILLNKTDGRAWTYIRDLAATKDAKELIDKETENEDGSPVTPEQREARHAIARVQIANLEGILATAAIEAFEFAPFNPEDGSGCTELDALILLQQYMEFAAGKD